MKKTDPKISIIIVYYHAKKVLFNCIKSIEKAHCRIPYEIIVVDNDEVKTIEKELKKLLPKVKYVGSPTNAGYGAAVNLGEKQASGEYIALINPDTIILPGSFETLYKHSLKEKDAGIVSAIMLDEDKHAASRQGGKILNPLNAIFSYSLITKYFPNNVIAKNYFLDITDVKGAIHSPSVPFGLALIKSTLFKKISGFDSNFFLYSEDFDICKRVEDARYKNYLCTDAQVIHLGGKGGSKDVQNVNEVYKKSRFYYFKKHYGLLAALVTTGILNFGKSTLLLTGILAVAAFILFYKLSDLMMFFGDAGWYYLAARDMLLTGNIPLVGVPSSHPWLHQGAFWTYFLGGIFALTKFNPLAPGFVVAGIGVITIFLLYRLGKNMFSQNVGLIAALLYSTSPMIATNTRVPYHTNLIPLLCIGFLYAIYKWIKGNVYFFPIIIFLLACLYNFEIATVPFLAVTVLLLFFGILKKKKYVLSLKRPKILFLSFLGWFVPMLPMLLYDLYHGFPQTIKFVIWMGYRVARLFGFPDIHAGETFDPGLPFIPFTLTKLQQLIFLPNMFIAVLIFFAIFVYLTYVLYKAIKRKNVDTAFLLVYVTFTVPAIFYLGIKTTSEAYWPMFFPTIILLLAIGLEKLREKKYLGIPIILAILAIAGSNIYTLLQQQYLMNARGNGPTFTQRLHATDQIIHEADGRKYTIIGKGPGSKFESFTMPYEYLTWWRGTPSSEDKKSIKIQIEEDFYIRSVKQIL